MDLCDFCVYLLATVNKPRKTYVGYTDDVLRRVEKHNTNRGAKATRNRNWVVFGVILCNSKRQAMSVEALIKNRSRRKSRRAGEDPVAFRKRVTDEVCQELGLVPDYYVC